VLLEGPRVISEAVQAGVKLELMAVREGLTPPAPADRVVELSAALFKYVSQTETPQGVLAVGCAGLGTFAEALSAARAAGWPLVVLDGVQDPGNVGAIARSAAAAGAPALVVLPGTADPFSPKAVRASAGNVFRLATAAAAWAELEGLTGFGAAARGDLRLDEAPLDSADFVVFGSEAHGLSNAQLQRVAIPMAAGVESLNVAVAAAIVLYEVRRRLAR
jgi:TrmH family RNA methyltransferase